MRSRYSLALLSALGMCAGLVAGCAANAEPISTSKTNPEAAGELGELCGDEPIIVGFAKGAGDTWTEITLATLKDEARKCPNIERVLFTDAGGDQNKAIADINGLVAQGVDVLIVMPEFGPAQLPALRAATRAGVTVVTQIDDIGAEIPNDIAASVMPDLDAVGQEWADWLDQTVGQGKVVFLGGIPGAQSSRTLFESLHKGLEKYPDLELVVDRVVDTDWNAGTRQRVMAGLLSKYGRIGGVVTDYGTIDYGTLNAYKQAGYELPALAAFASSNGISCYWADDNFPLLSIDGQTTVIRESLRQGLAAFNEVSSDDSGTVELVTSIDTNAGIEPACDPNLPDDAALGSDLSDEALNEIFH